PGAPAPRPRRPVDGERHHRRRSAAVHGRRRRGRGADRSLDRRGCAATRGPDRAPPGVRPRARTRRQAPGEHLGDPPRPPAPRGAACAAPAPRTGRSVPPLLSGPTPYRHGGVTETRKLSTDLTLLPEMRQRQRYEPIGESASPWVSARYGMTQGFDEFHLYNTDDELMLYDFMKLAMRLDPWDVFRLRDWLPSYAYVPFGTLVDDAVDMLHARHSQAPLFL